MIRLGWRLGGRFYAGLGLIGKVLYSILLHYKIRYFVYWYVYFYLYWYYYLFIEILIYFRDFLSSFCIPRRDFFVRLGYCIYTFWCITVSLYCHAYFYVFITDI